MSVCWYKLAELWGTLSKRSLFVVLRLSLPFLATLIVVLICLFLAHWQLERAKAKEKLEAMYLAAQQQEAIDFPDFFHGGQIEYRRVKLVGEFVASWPLYLDNRALNGHPGMMVVMPFKLQKNGRYVLVIRGWLPRNSQNRMIIAPYTTPTGMITIEGQIKMHVDRVLPLGNDVPLQPGRLVQNMSPHAFIVASHFATYPFFIDQFSELSDGLKRPRYTTEWAAAIQKHRGYAFQWVALALLACIFFLVAIKRQYKHKAS